MSARNALALAAIFATGIVFDTAMPAKAEIDHGRQCLALAGFAEARGDGDAAMAAVMQVVLNRATDPAQRWPQTICGVVMQPGQFVGVGRWRYPRRPDIAELPAWNRALELADQTIDGSAPVPADCAGATSFHRARGVAGLQPICRIASHTFYIEPRASVAGETQPERQRSP